METVIQSLRGDRDTITAWRRDTSACLIQFIAGKFTADTSACLIQFIAGKFTADTSACLIQFIPILVPL